MKEIYRGGEDTGDANVLKLSVASTGHLRMRRRAWIAVRRDRSTVSR